MKNLTASGTFLTRVKVISVLFSKGALTPESCAEGPLMARPWEAEPTAAMARRLGRSPEELDNTDRASGCPDIWELDNGDIAVIGRDLTDAYARRLPPEAALAEDERLVIIPRNTLISAKADIPDA